MVYKKDSLNIKCSCPYFPLTLQNKRIKLKEILAYVS